MNSFDIVYCPHCHSVLVFGSMITYNKLIDAKLECRNCEHAFNIHVYSP